MVGSTYGLASFVGSPALARLLVHFSLHPEAALHFRALQRHTSLGTASLQTELERLEKLGLIARERQNRKVVFHPRLAHPAWRPIRALIREFADPIEVLRDALSAVGGIEAAFLYGSFSTGDVHEESDIDVLVLGESIAPAGIGMAGLEASALLGRQVDICRYTRSQMEGRLALGSVFLRSVLEGPKRWIIGDRKALPEAA